jgi:proteasome accessory factor B
MADSISKTQRLLDVVAFLAGHRFPVTIEDIMAGVPAYGPAWVEGTETQRQSLRRKFERDKDDLRAAGIPLETVPYSIGYENEKLEGYRLQKKDFHLPYLRLAASEGRPTASEPRRAAQGAIELELDDARLAFEALAMAAEAPGFPMAREAQSARRKLTFDLDPGTVPRAEIRFAEHPAAGEERELVRLLSDALLARKRVAFTYGGITRDEVTEREVDPYGLLFQHGHWYLIGHDHLRSDLRVFRTSRISALSVNKKRPKSPDYEVPADFDLADHVDRQAWELGGEEGIEVTAQFDFPRSLWVEASGLGREIERDPSSGVSTRSFDVRSTDPFLRWVLSLQGEARIIAPPELVEALREMARRVSGTHGERTDE